MKTKKFNIWSVDFKTYQILTVRKWKSKGFVWHAGHLNFLKYSYLTSVYWRAHKKKRLKKDVRGFYQNYFTPQLSLSIFEKKTFKQQSLF